MTTEATGTTSTTKPLKLFYCYARVDKAYRDELDNHLSGLKRSHQIASWSDREISPGVEWKIAIDKELNTAHIILLLVSSSFMASDYCYGIEMKRALERHEEGKARVVPILLRAVDWEDAPFSKLQILPSDAKPISHWPDHDDALEDIAKGLRKVVKELQSSLKTKEEWFEEGNKLHNLQQYDEAILAYDQAIKLDPNFEVAYYKKSVILSRLNQFDEAILAFNQAIKLNPILSLAYYNKSVTLHHLNRSKEANVAFKKAKELGYSG